MNRVEPSPPLGDLDAALRAFFAAEMPAPWPTFQPPTTVLPFPSPRPAPARRRWQSSRLALAASVALLALGALALPARLNPARVGGGVKMTEPGKATKPLPPFNLPEEKDAPAKPEKAKTKVELRMAPDGRVGVGVTVEEDPSNR